MTFSEEGTHLVNVHEVLSGTVGIGHGGLVGAVKVLRAHEEQA